MPANVTAPSPFARLAELLALWDSKVPTPTDLDRRLSLVGVAQWSYLLAGLHRLPSRGTGLAGHISPEISQQAMAGALRTRAMAGATIVVVLHELGPFEPLIHRTVVLREGRIAYDGPPAAIAARIDHHGHEHCDPEPAEPALAPLADPFGGIA